MGNEVSTVGGAACTTAMATASAITLGQVQVLNNATVECARFTADKASITTVRLLAEATGTAAAAAGATLVVGVTLGQVDSVNEMMLELAEHTAKSGALAVKAVTEAGSGVLNGVPLVGHLKGAAHYAAGDREGGDEAIRQASRTAGVVAGGVVAMAGGPAMMVAGGIAGGAVMDAVITGVESAIREEFVPCGYVRALDNVIKARDGQSVVEGVVEGLTTPIMDGMAARAAAGTIKKAAGRVKRVGGGARVAAKVAKSTMPSFDGGSIGGQSSFDSRQNNTGSYNIKQTGCIYVDILGENYLVGVDQQPQRVSDYYQSWECRDIALTWRRLKDKLCSEFQGMIVEENDTTLRADGGKVGKAEIIAIIDDIIERRLTYGESSTISYEFNRK